MNPWLKFCKNTAIAIKYVLEFTRLAVTWSILSSDNEEGVPLSAIRAAKIINTLCLALSPLIIVASLLFTIGAGVAIVVAGMVGGVVSLTSCKNGFVEEDEKSNTDTLNNSYAVIVYKMAAVPTPPITIPPPPATEEHRDSLEGLSEYSEVSASKTSSIEEESSLCYLGIM